MQMLLQTLPQTLPVTTQFSWINALWSLGLFFLGLGVMWYKLHLLRMEIHTLVEKLPQIGSEFIRGELSEMQDQLDETRARQRIIEEHCGINGG